MHYFFSLIPIFFSDGYLYFTHIIPIHHFSAIHHSGIYVTCISSFTFNPLTIYLFIYPCINSFISIIYSFIHSSIHLRIHPRSHPLRIYQPIHYPPTLLLCNRRCMRTSARQPFPLSCLQLRALRGLSIKSWSMLSPSPCSTSLTRKQVGVVWWLF